ncbi:MAG: hypothetical protein ACRENO_07475, partial [Thermodesulfobacteriota bacterium]
GVWIGIDDNSPLGNKESGSRAALPIWVDFMEDALTNKYKNSRFQRPSGIKFINTPYGDIPYKVSTIKENIIEMLKASVKAPHDSKDEVEDVDFANDQSEIDFLLRR